MVNCQASIHAITLSHLTPAGAHTVAFLLTLSSPHQRPPIPSHPSLLRFYAKHAAAAAELVAADAAATPCAPDPAGQEAGSTCLGSPSSNNAGSKDGSCSSSSSSSGNAGADCTSRPLLPPAVSINSDFNDTQVGALLTSLAGAGGVHLAACTPFAATVRHAVAPRCHCCLHFCTARHQCRTTQRPARTPTLHAGLHPPSLSLHVSTLGVPGAWASVEHVCLNWCNQLVQPLSRMLVGAASQALQLSRSQTSGSRGGVRSLQHQQQEQQEQQGQQHPQEQQLRRVQEQEQEQEQPGMGGGSTPLWSGASDVFMARAQHHLLGKGMLGGDEQVR